MDIQPVAKFPSSVLDKLLSAISFYQQVKHKDPYQYEMLMTYSRIEEFDAGDRVIHQGDDDSWLYFLLRGQLLVVSTDNQGHEQHVNTITPGEVFGSLSTLLHVRRTASVFVEPNSRGAMIFGTDFSIFGELRDISKVSFETKLMYYQNLVHSLRWQLESYRIRFPGHKLSESHHKIKLFMGKKGSWEELESLETQGKALAHLVIEWNHELLGHEHQPERPLKNVYL